jgi:hypothetical protein
LAPVDPRKERTTFSLRNSGIYARDFSLRSAAQKLHLIFFSSFSQKPTQKTNKTFYTLSPFAYMFVRDEPTRLIAQTPQA